MGGPPSAKATCKHGPLEHTSNFPSFMEKTCKHHKGTYVSEVNDNIIPFLRKTKDTAETSEMGTKSGLGLDCECILDVGTQEVSASHHHWALPFVLSCANVSTSRWPLCKFEIPEWRDYEVYQGFTKDLPSYSLQVWIYMRKTPAWWVL